MRVLSHPDQVYAALLSQIIRLAEHGLVHGDFNEFNLLIDDDEEITIIDFPQMTSTSHPNAQYYFERDVKCLQAFFNRRFGLVFEGVPRLEGDIDKREDLDKEIKASGFLKDELKNEDDMDEFERIHELYLNKEEGEQEEEDEEDKDEGEEEEEDKD